MPAATTAAHVVRPCAALAQRHAHAKQRRKRQRPVRSAQHVAPAWTIAKVGIGPITTVRMVTAPIQIAHAPTALLAIALIAQKVIAPSMTALVSVMTIAAVKVAAHKVVRTVDPSGVTHVVATHEVVTAALLVAQHVIKTEAPIVAETSVGVLTTAMVHAMTHVRIRVAQVAMTAKIALDLIVLAPTLPINANAMSATPRKHRVRQPSRQSAVMTTARCVCPS